MTYTFKPMTKNHAESILTWKYQKPYDFYDFEANEEMMSELMNGEYFSVFNDNDIGTLIGFLCVGNSARISGGYTARIYERAELLDVGLGLEPSQTGKGLGRLFEKEGIDYLRQQLNQEKFRLMVASFNQRAIHVYRENGFIENCKLMSNVNAKDIEFVCMIKEH